MVSLFPASYVLLVADSAATDLSGPSDQPIQLAQVSASVLQKVCGK
jgi:hypothetical protein